MTPVKRAVSVALLLSAAIVGGASSGAWQEFRSSNGFSVTYPATWVRQNVSPDRLDILSSRGHQEAVVIGKGEAEMFVVKEPESTGRTFPQVIQYYERETKVQLDREIPEGRRGACERLEEVVSKGPPVPPEDVPAYVRPQLTNFTYTALFCRIEDHTFVVMLKNWEGDSRAVEYQEIARRVAGSIRISR